MRNVISIGLLQCNYQVIETSNPYIAVMKVLQFLPDIVVVDIPEANTKGFLIVNALKKSVQTRHIPILIVIPSTPADMVNTLKEEYRDSEIADSIDEVTVLTYPFNFALLVETIKGIIPPE